MPDIGKYAISYSVNKTAYLRKFNRRIKKVAATNFSDLKNFRLILINLHIKFFIKKIPNRIYARRFGKVNSMSLII